MEDYNFFYYTLSTIPQVLAATIAVLAAFIHFRLKAVSKFLIGEGRVVYIRDKKNEYKMYKQGFSEDQKEDWRKYSDRLRDGVIRNSIKEVNEGLSELAKYDKMNKCTGLKANYKKKFKHAMKLYYCLQSYTFLIVGFKVLTIISSIWCLSRFKCAGMRTFAPFYLHWNTALFIGCLVATSSLVLYTLVETKYENLFERDKAFGIN